MRTLATGIYLVCFIAFSTAHMGAQTEPMLFLLLGWGEAIKARKPEDNLMPGMQMAPTAPKPTFRRVLI